MRSMVEGAPRPTSFHDPENQALEVVEHLLRWDPQSKETQILKISVPGRIPRRTIASAMRFAIDLDRQACGQAGKVEHERPLRALLPELESVGALLQRPPEQAFGRAQVLPKFACELYRLDWSLQQTRAPSTSLRLVALPVPGRNKVHRPPLWISAVRSMTQTSSSLWLSIRCSKVTIPASGLDFESLREITSVSALKVSPMKTGLGIRTLS